MNVRMLITGGIFVALVAAMVFAGDPATTTKSGSIIEGGITALYPMLSSPSGCCVGTTGNVDCDPSDGVDISDLSSLIDFLYISRSPLCCAAEANIDGDPDGGIDISDLSALIDYLYISFTMPAPCATNVVFSSFSGQIQPIFSLNCATAGCHTGAIPAAGLKLSTGQSYSNLVNVVSSGYSPAKRVVPSDTLASVLYHKVKGTGVYGNQMPLTGSLTPSEIELIISWIAAGAPNN